MGLPPLRRRVRGIYRSRGSNYQTGERLVLCSIPIFFHVDLAI